jgi:hypothetical protein
MKRPNRKYYIKKASIIQLLADLEIYIDYLEAEKKQLTLTDVGCSFTFEEVEKLLKTQRGNCCVAVMKHILDDEILYKISNAPMYDYKKAKAKK